MSRTALPARRAAPVAGLAAGAWVVGLAAFVILGSDLLWVVALGDAVRDQGSVPTGVPFASAPQAGWHNPVVLAEVLLSLVDGLGPQALAALQLVLVGAHARGAPRRRSPARRGRGPGRGRRLARRRRRLVGVRRHPAALALARPLRPRRGRDAPSARPPRPGGVVARPALPRVGQPPRRGPRRAVPSSGCSSSCPGAAGRCCAGSASASGARSPSSPPRPARRRRPTTCRPWATRPPRAGPTCGPGPTSTTRSTSRCCSPQRCSWPSRCARAPRSGSGWPSRASPSAPPRPPATGCGWSSSSGRRR